MELALGSPLLCLVEQQWLLGHRWEHGQVFQFGLVPAISPSCPCECRMVLRLGARHTQRVGSREELVEELKRVTDVPPVCSAVLKAVASAKQAGEADKVQNQLHAVGS